MKRLHSWKLLKSSRFTNAKVASIDGKNKARIVRAGTKVTNNSADIGC